MAWQQNKRSDEASFHDGAIQRGAAQGTFNRGFQRFGKRSLCGPSLPGILVEVQKVGTRWERKEGDARTGSVWGAVGFLVPRAAGLGKAGASGHSSPEPQKDWVGAMSPRGRMNPQGTRKGTSGTREFGKSLFLS